MGVYGIKRRVLAVACAVILCAGALGALSACGGSKDTQSAQGPGAMRSFTDSCGRSVEIPATIDRVAVTGSITQQVFLTFAPDKMVGLAIPLDGNVQAYIGEQYANLPVYGQIYGGKGDLNKEALAAADPQVVVDIGEGKDTVSADMDALQDQLGVPCVHIEAVLATYDEAYRMLGELTGMKERADEMAAYCRKAYDGCTEVLAKIDDAQKPRGIYAVDFDWLGVIAKGSYQAQVVDSVLDNIAVFDSPSSKGTGNEVSMEQIALWNPDFIVCGENLYDRISQGPEWADIAAVKSGSYYKVPGDPYSWLSNPPTVNQLLGLQWLARLAYPDSFSDDVKDVVTGYYKLFYGYEMGDAEYADFMKDSVLR